MSDSDLSREDVRDMLEGWYVKLRAIQGKMLNDFPDGSHQFEKFWDFDTRLKELYIAMHCAEHENPRERCRASKPSRRCDGRLDAHLAASKRKRIDLLHDRVRGEVGDGEGEVGGNVTKEKSQDITQVPAPTIKKRPLLKRPTPKPKPRRLPDEIEREPDITINIFEHQEDPKQRLSAIRQPRHYQINKAKLISKSTIMAHVLADKKGKWIHADDDIIVWDPIISNRVKKFGDRKAIVYLDGLMASEYVVREDWWVVYTAAQIWGGFKAFVHWIDKGEVLKGCSDIEAAVAIQVAFALGADEMYQYELAALYTPEAVELELPEL
ncbi:hypothetical protein DL98DRAFT_660515 [Cadophora sp. DSE1049]|nr:hypothetical protein DL98DRAFT_660515 [Cadophora sp. DSE1049]